MADLPSSDYTALTNRLRAPPSAGLCLLHQLHRLRGPLPAESLFGFAFTDQLGRNGASSHYFEATRPSMHHNWLKEREVFRSLLA